MDMDQPNEALPVRASAVRACMRVCARRTGWCVKNKMAEHGDSDDAPRAAVERALLAAELREVEARAFSVPSLISLVVEFQIEPDRRDLGQESRPPDVAPRPTAQIEKAHPGPEIEAIEVDRQHDPPRSRMTSR